MAKKPKKKKKKPAKLRRLGREARAAAQLRKDQETLAALEAGGSTERPLDVPSPSVVEPRAIALGCVYCEAVTKLRAHDAVQVEGRLLRKVVTECSGCGETRTVWVRPSPTLN